MKTVIRFHTKAGPVVVGGWGGFGQVQPEVVGSHVEPKPVQFSVNVTRFEEVSPMHTLSTLGAPSSSRSRD